jgi:hypothetical protein
MMLAAHSRLSIPPETWYLLPLVKRFSFDRPLNPDEIEAAVSIITGHYRWPDMKLSTSEFRGKVQQLARPYLRDLVEIVYRWHMQADGKVRWGDKTPLYIGILPELARMFPDARFIHLIRDGRDVAKSFRATDWVGWYWHDNAREWIRALECHWRWIRSDIRDRILEVRYEKLVLETETTLQEICRFIGEEFEPQMLSWERHVDQLVPSREMIVHQKLKQRIGPEGVFRWKREMSARQIFVTEAFMGSHLMRLGYERRYASPLWLPAFALTRWIYPALVAAIEFRVRAVGYLRKRIRVRQGSRGCADSAGKQ